MGLIADAISRGWANFLERPSGPLGLRFLMQPTVAAVLAVRAGIEDARLGRPAFLWTMLTDPRQRWRSVQSGWKDVRNVFLIAATLDAIYQLIIQQFIYPLELLFTSALLAVVPYCVLRGPVNRVVRRAMGRSRGADSSGGDSGSRPG
jgi:hypothetical protein